ncbi:hypothetical protein C1H46_018341 [Malus baccata]|uniref:Methenyltetrahydrofolate cyclohydrolase n=1 Tax=Malus baccata TaxID=106549 RepID=A0A540MBZ0_MALBA|nr:hypothetical protein C1H46_018341 [Malus baccata]
MASMIFTDCSSSTTPRLLRFRRNPLFHRNDGAVFLRPLISPTSPRRLSLHSSSASSSPSPSATASLATEASAAVIDGKGVAKQIRDEINAEVSKMKDAIGIVPGLAVILVGDRKDSATYVRNKKKACESVGIKSFEVRLPEDSSEREVLNSVARFNDDPSLHGILVQLPLPSYFLQDFIVSKLLDKGMFGCPMDLAFLCPHFVTKTLRFMPFAILDHMNEQNILNAVSIEKDVDGFHPLNIGRLAMRGRDPLFVPCTPKGCIELLHRYGIPIKGKRAVVIGRSNIVGMPAALLLQREDATISIVHSRTKNPEEIARQADIIISAVGQPNMVRGSWIKPGAVIIDVGINPVEVRKASLICRSIVLCQLFLKRIISLSPMFLADS